MIKLLRWCYCLLLCAAFSTQATQIVYVNQNAPTNGTQTGVSWTNAYVSLQTALAALPPNQPAEIWVAKGTYYPCPANGAEMNRNASFRIPSGVTIYGGFAGWETNIAERIATNLTVLSGDVGLPMRDAITSESTTNDLLNARFAPLSTASPDINCQDNCFNVITCASVTNVVLDRLVIFGGYAGNIQTNGTNLISNLQLEQIAQIGPDANRPTSFPLTNIVAGGGILLRFEDNNLSHPASENALTVRNCFFLNNYAAGYGGAICAFGGNIVVEGAQFRNNWAGMDGGAIWDASAHSEIQGCTFGDNISQGSGGAVAYMAFNTADTLNPEQAQDVRTLIRARMASGRLAQKVYVKLFNPLTIMKIAANIDSASASVASGVGSSMTAAGGVCTAFSVVGAVMTAVQVGTSVAEFFGVDPDDPVLGVFVEITAWWNRITSPISWATELANLCGESNSYNDYYMEEQYRRNQLLAYNISRYSLMDHCVFTTNSANVVGGAVAMSYKNVQVQNSWFAYNYAATSGGALSCSDFGKFKVAVCVFYGNSSALGHSVAYNYGNARVHYINCTIAHNASGSTNSFAIGNELGANVKLFNSILWNNLNALHPEGGADLYTAMPHLLSPELRRVYDEAGVANRGDFVSTCDIQGCDIQSLDQLPTARKIYPGINSPEDQRGYWYQDNDTQLMVDRYDSRGLSEEYGWVNLAPGNMVLDNRGLPQSNAGVNPELDGAQGYVPCTTNSAFRIARSWLRTYTTGLTHDIFGYELYSCPGAVDPGAFERVYSELDWAQTWSVPPEQVENSIGNWRAAWELITGRADAAGLIARRFTSFPVPPLPTFWCPPSEVPAAPGAVIYVNASATGTGSGSDWANAVPSLATALGSSNLAPGIQVWVALGSYTAPIGGFQVPNGAKLYGGFAGTEGLPSQRTPGARTILAGGGGRILTLSGKWATIDGFHFTGGIAEAGTGGGAIYGTATNGSYAIRNCAFSANQASQTNGNGGAVFLAGSANVTGCQFDRNLAAHQGGALYLEGESAIYNCLFTGNSAADAGGAVAAAGADLNLCHDTFYSNTLSGAEPVGTKLGGAGVFFNAAAGGHLAVTNCIFWTNAAPHSSASVEWQQLAVVPWTIYSGESGHRKVSVGSSLIQGLFAYSTTQPTGLADDANYIHYPAEYDPLGGVDVDPLFIDAARNNFQLQPSSSAIGAGTIPLGRDFPDTDLAGNPRLSSQRPKEVGVLDLGAFQFQGVPNVAAATVAVEQLCGDHPSSYLLRASWTSNAQPSTLTWQTWSNGMWANIQLPGAIYQTVQSNCLMLVKPPRSFNGTLYRIRAEGSPGFTSRNYARVVMPPVLFVKTNGPGGDGLSWQTAFASPEQAIEAAGYYDAVTRQRKLFGCQEIWVAQGTYRVPDYTYLKQGVSIFGGFSGTETELTQRDWRSNTTIIAGGGGVSGVRNTMFMANGCDGNTVIDGLIFTNAGCAIAASCGAPTIQNCRFQNNQSAISYGQDQYRGCIPAPALLANCTFEANAGGVDVSGANLTILNCLFTHNTTHSAPVTAQYGCSAKLVNCTIADNVGLYCGGAMSCYGATLEVINSIIWGNSSTSRFGRSGIDASQLVDSLPGYGTPGTLIVSHSLVQGWQGECMRFDPLFVQSGVDYHLKAHSPALNVGSPAALAGVTEDLDGNLRTRAANVGTGVDLGAYQFQGTPDFVMAFHHQPGPETAWMCAMNPYPTNFTASATNDLSSAVWLVNQGSGFVPATNAALFSSSLQHSGSTNTATLSLPSPNLGMNGWTFALQLNSFTSPPVSLSVQAPSTVYVNASANGANNGTSWADAFTGMDAAMAVAGSCMEIWVAQGTYTNSSGTYTLHYNERVYGGFAGGETNVSQRDWEQHPTVLVGGASGPLFKIGSWFDHTIDEATMLDGVVLRSACKKGALISEYGTATIQNCLFDSCAGYAIFNDNYSGSISNCTFINGKDSAIHDFSSSPRIVGCSFVNNNAALYGGAIYQNGFEPEVTDCRFSNNVANSGGAIYTTGGLNVNRCVFQSNSSGNGGAVSISGDSVRVLIRNSLFSENTSSFKGGAIENSSSMLQVVNCTFVRNKTALGGGAIEHSAVGGLLANSILWGNPAHPSIDCEQAQLLIGAGVDGSGSLTVSNCCIQGLVRYQGNGNHAFDPLFAAPGNNWHLTALSPALGAGNSGFLAGETSDLDGNPRTRTGGTASDVDMGACQFQGVPLPPLQLYNAPSELSSCSSGMPLTFTVSAPTNLVAGVWLVHKADTNGFVPATNSALFSSEVRSGHTNIATLTILAAAPEMDGWHFAFQLGSVTTPPAELTMHTPTVVYVNGAASGANNGASWSNAFTSLDAAMAQAGTCSQIWVAQGTYTNSGIAWVPHQSQGVYGGFVGGETNLNQRDWAHNPTILIGGTNQPLFKISSAYEAFDATTVVDGFVLRSAHAFGAVQNEYGASTIQNCVFDSCAGWAVNNQSFSGTILNCTFTNCQDSAIYNSYSSPLIRGCSFVNNRAFTDGGAIYNGSGDCQPLVTDCLFSNNIVTSVIYSYDGGLGVDRCVFVTNRCSTGVGSVIEIKGGNAAMAHSIRNSLFNGNRAQVIANASSTLRVVNCTLAENRSDYGSAIYHSGVGGLVANCILWGNSVKNAYGTYLTNENAQLLVKSGGALTVSNSCLQGVQRYEGNGNKGSDPLFASSALDFHLCANSPALGGGNPVFLAGATKDIEGNPRTRSGGPGSGLDLGAYQYQGTPGASMAFYSFPQSIWMCSLNTQSASFYASASNDLSGAVWLVNQGDGFVPVTNSALFSTSVQNSGFTNIATLTVSTPSLEMSGWQFALQVGSFTTPAALLIVQPQQIVYVNAAASGANNGTSWADAFISMDSAMVAAGPCSEIWVAEGTYTNSGVSWVPRPNQAIYGGFAGGETNLSQRDLDNNATIFVGGTVKPIFQIGASGGSIQSATILDGFVLRSGHSRGAVVNSSGDGTVRNCVFESCAGWAILNSDFSGTISNCTFTNGQNSAIYSYNSTPHIAGCAFLNNHAPDKGGALYFSGSQPVVTDCTFNNNVARAGGAIHDLSGPLILNRCIFVGNHSSGPGGAIYLGGSESSEYLIKNSLFRDNTVSSGGGGAVADYSGRLKAVNCTFVGNRSVDPGAAIACLNGAVLVNSILWDNAAILSGYTTEQQQLDAWRGTLAVSNCCIQGLQQYAGNGNMGFDPLFASPGSCHLSANSPLLGAGNPALLGGDVTDLDGAPRTRAGAPGSGLDMGARQFQGSPGAVMSFLNYAQSLSICSMGVPVAFGASAINDLSGAVWLVNDGTGFVPATNSALFSSSIQNGATNTASLTILAPSLEMQGWQFAFRLGPVTLPAVSLGVHAPSKIYVDASATGANNGTSWTDAFVSVGDALAAVATCSEVWVAQGNYTNSGSTAWMLNQNAGVYGGFAGGETSLSQRDWVNHPTVLVGNASKPIIQIGSSAGDATAASTVLDGFVLRSSCPSGAVVNQRNGGTIANCAFESCAGYAINSSYFSGSIVDCAFSNGQDSAVCNSYSSPHISGCVFVNNRASKTSSSYGGAIHDFESRSVVTDSIFRNNVASLGGAIYSIDGGMDINRCTFQTNGLSGGTGGAIYITSDQELTSSIKNSLFSGNTAGQGAAIENGCRRLQIVNCTFVGNQSVSQGAVEQRKGVGFIANSILWDNTITQGARYGFGKEQAQVMVSGGTLIVSNCCVEGLQQFVGNGNIELNPLFAAPGRDCRLTANSPVLGGGNPAFLAGGTTDLNRAPRTRGGGPGSGLDMGACQFQDAPGVPLSFLSCPQPVSSCPQGASITFSASTTNELNAAVWLVDAGSGMVPTTNSALFSSSTETGSINTATLTVLAPDQGMDGWQFALQIGSGTTPPAILSMHSPTVVYVDGAATGANNGTSWTDAFTSLATALASAGSCSQIWVAQGTYVNPGGAAYKLQQSQGIYGGFAGMETNLIQSDYINNRTVLMGGASQPIFLLGSADNPADSSTVVDGFVLHSACASGGVVNQSGAATIRNCTFDSCAGYAISNKGYSGAILHCTFTNGQNSAICNNSSHPRISACSFVNNHSSAEGAALCDSSSQPIVTDCTFSGNTANSGGAIHSVNGGLDVARCVFEGNGANNTGGSIMIVADAGAYSIRDSLFSRNAASQGAAIYNVSSALNVVNCTFAANQSVSGGGAVAHQGNGGLVANSILWGNTANPSSTDNYTAEKAQLHVGSGRTITVMNCCLQGLQRYTGNGNIGFNPLFVAPGSDYRLTANSPLLGGGNPALLAEDSTDLDGNPRTRSEGTGSGLDLGAYQHQGTPGDAIAFYEIPEGVSVCSRSVQPFTFTASATNDLSGAVWLVNYGTGFLPATNAALFSNSLQIGATNTAALTIVRPDLGMNGWQIAFQVGSFTTPSALLTVPSPEVIYVNAAATGANNGTSWTDAFTNMDPAMAAAGTCSEIWVAEGTYTNSATWMLAHNQGVYGGFAGGEVSLSQRNVASHPTVLVGDAGQPIIRIGSDLDRTIDAGTVLDGFVLRSSASDGAVVNYHSSGTIANCTFESCAGRGIYNFYYSGNILNCAFNNGQDSAIYNNLSSPVISHCSFVNNRASQGGGLCEATSQSIVTDCTFINNSASGKGGAIYSFDGGLTLNRCAFLTNTSPDLGGAVFVQSDRAWAYSIKNSLFSGSMSSTGGGAVASLCRSLEVVNCTFVENRAAQYGAAIAQFNNNGHVANSIFWNNTIDSTYYTNDQAQVYVSSGITLLVNNCCIQKLQKYSGNNNLALDPAFASPGVNYHLGASSPLLGAGDLIAIGTETSDLDGNPRTRTGDTASGVDIGAYQFPGSPGTPMVITNSPVSFTYCLTTSNGFKVGASGSNLSYQWQVDRKDGLGFAAVVENEFTHGAATAELSFTGYPEFANGWLYRCAVSSGGGTVHSAAATLTIPNSRIYVNAAAPPGGNGQSWATAFTNVSQAMLYQGTQPAVNPCAITEVWVARGNYAFNYAIFPSNLVYYGGFNGTETSRDHRNWIDNPAIISVSNSAATESPLLDGFTFVSPGKEVLTCMTSNRLAHCTFATNSIAVKADSANSSVRIEDCHFLGNTNVAIARYYAGGSLIISNCFFSGNGKCLSWNGATAELTQSRFWNNSYGVSFNGAQASIRRCMFQGNTAIPISIYSTTATLSDSLMAGNLCGGRGAIDQTYGSLVIRNCTVAGNLGSGIYASSGDRKIYNSVFWDNSSSLVGTIAESRNSFIQGQSGSEPLFLERIDFAQAPTTAGNFAGSPCSPLLLAGNPTYSVTTLDLVGAARLHASGKIDVGAYQFHGTAAESLAISSCTTNEIACEAYPARFTVVPSRSVVSYQWLQSGAGSSLFTVLEDNENFSGSHSATLTVSNVTSGMNSNRYRCILTSAEGCTLYSPAATLVYGVPVWAAVDAPQLAFTRSGNSYWLGQTNVTHDGIAALQSGPVTYNQESSVSTTVIGPATVSFWYKLSGKNLSFYIDTKGYALANNSIIEWRQTNYNIGSGSHTLRWTYADYGGGSIGTGAAWVDQLSVVPNPQIVEQPFSQVISAGDNACFEVTATGYKPISYQWLRNGTPITGATCPVFWITNVQTADIGTYSVVVSNWNGAVTSSNAALTLGLSLARALDTPDRAWATGGNLNWIGQTLASYDGTNAAQSGAIGPDQKTWIQTVIHGPGTLSFWWRTSSSANHSSLQFSTNGVTTAQLSGLQDWQQVTQHFDPGTYTVRWCYSKDSTSVIEGQNSAWLDQVSYIFDTCNLAVTTTADSGPGSLRQAILDSATTPAPCVVDATALAGSITLQSALPIITNSLTLNGPGAANLAINGAGSNRIFFIDAPWQSVNVNGVTLSNGLARGGNGGLGAGGGGGMGGALFVNAGAVTVGGVKFVNNAAVGGQGGNQGLYGGGGGLGGNGGSSLNFAGGGGGGFAGNGGAGSYAGGGGGGVTGNGGDGADAGGGGGGWTDGTSASGSLAGLGGVEGGNGASTTSVAMPGSAYGGGGGGCSSYSTTPGVGNGANGGRFGGGGGAGNANAGDGGDFGGGGGKSGVDEYQNGGAGGFGAGGGAGGATSKQPGGTGGFGGGGGGGVNYGVVNGPSIAYGGAGGYRSGGGGAALGGAIFVRDGASLDFIDSSTDAGAVAGGTAGDSTAQPGSAAGSAMFLLGGINAFTVSAGASNYIGGSIAGWSAKPGVILKNGPGTLCLATNNNFTGTIQVNAGTLLINGTNASSAVTVNSGTILSGKGTVGPLTLQAGATLSPGLAIGTITSSNTVWTGTGNYNWKLYDAAGDAGAGYDRLIINGTLNLSGVTGFNVNCASLSNNVAGAGGPAIHFANTAPMSWTIVQTTGGITGFDPAKFSVVVAPTNGTTGFANDIGAGQFRVTLSSDGRDLVLRFLASQTIAFDSLGEKMDNAAPFAISATASSGLPVSFSIVSGPATIGSNIITLTGGHGTVIVEAAQGGNEFWGAAAPVRRQFDVTPSVVTLVSPTSSALYERQYVGVAIPMSVVVTPTAGVSYQWFKNGVAIEGANQSNYTWVADLVTNTIAGRLVVVSNFAFSVRAAKTNSSITAEIERVNVRRDDWKAPLVKVTSPVSASRIDTVVLSGTITEDQTVKELWYYFTNINLGVKTITTSNNIVTSGGTVNRALLNAWTWQMPVTPMPGSNTLVVIAVNQKGQSSVPVAVPFFYKVPHQVPVSVAGDLLAAGSNTVTLASSVRDLSAKLGGGENWPSTNLTLFEGQTYSAKILLDKKAWYDNTVITADSYCKTETALAFTFQARSNMTITFNIRTNRFGAGLNGLWNGLFQVGTEPNQVTLANAGAITGLKIDPIRGLYSGKITLKGWTSPFKGMFDRSGHASCAMGWWNTKVSPAVSNYVGNLEITLPFDHPKTNQFVGTVSHPTEGWTATLKMVRQATNDWSGTNMSLAIAAAVDHTQAPGGYGYSKQLFGKLGSVSYAGILGDGYKLAGRTTMSPEGKIPVCVPLYLVPQELAPGVFIKVGKGMLFGWMDKNDPTATLTWIKEPGMWTNYPGGFTVTPTVEHAMYVAPGIGQNPFSGGPALVDFLGGDLQASLTFNVALTNSVRLTTTNTLLIPLEGSPTNIFTAKVDQLRALVSGTVGNGKGKAVIKWSSGILQSRNAAYGFYVGTNNCTGSVILH